MIYSNKNGMTTLLIMLFSIPILAQVQVGLKVGGNQFIPLQYNEFIDFDEQRKQIGLQIGVLVEIPIEDKYAFTTEFNLLNRRYGNRSNLTGADFRMLNETQYKAEYIQWMLLGKTKIWRKGDTQLFIQGGFSMDYLSSFDLSEKTTEFFAEEVFSEEVHYDVDFGNLKFINRLFYHLHFVLGAEQHIGQGWLFVDSRFDIGLNVLGLYEFSGFTARNRGWQLNVGYKYTFKK